MNRETKERKIKATIISGVVFGLSEVVGRMLKEWDESAHPRDEQGRFCGGGGGEGGGDGGGGGGDGTGDARTAATWGVTVNSSSEELEAAGYIRVYRGTSAAGIDAIAPSSNGVYGGGVYFYTDPAAANSYVEMGGGIVTAYVNPFEGVVIDSIPGRNYSLVVARDIGAIIRRGTISAEEIENGDIQELAETAINDTWDGYK